MSRLGLKARGGLAFYFHIVKGLGEDGRAVQDAPNGLHDT